MAPTKAASQRPVQQQHGIGDFARGVASGFAPRHIMQMKLRQHFPVVKAKIADAQISALSDRGVIRRRPLGAKERWGCDLQNAEPKKHEGGQNSS